MICTMMMANLVLQCGLLLSFLDDCLEDITYDRVDNGNVTDDPGSTEDLMGGDSTDDGSSSTHPTTEY